MYIGCTAFLNTYIHLYFAVQYFNYKGTSKSKFRYFLDFIFGTTKTCVKKGYVG